MSVVAEPDGFDLALQIVFVWFSLPGQRGQTFVRYRACSIQKKLHGKNGNPTEGRGGDSGSTATGGGGSPVAGTGGRGGEGEGSSLHHSSRQRKYWARCFHVTIMTLDMTASQQVEGIFGVMKRGRFISRRSSFFKVKAELEKRTEKITVTSRL